MSSLCIISTTENELNSISDDTKEWWKMPQWKGKRGKDKDDSSDDLQYTHISKPPDDISDICPPIAVHSKADFSKCKDTYNVAAC
eukprot:12759124-Ditylum_brightwellii.AAC.1